MIAGAVLPEPPVAIARQREDGLELVHRPGHVQRGRGGEDVEDALGLPRRAIGGAGHVRREGDVVPLGKVHRRVLRPAREDDRRDGGHELLDGLDLIGKAPHVTAGGRGQLARPALQFRIPRHVRVASIVDADVVVDEHPDRVPHLDGIGAIEERVVQHPVVQAPFRELRHGIQLREVPRPVRRLDDLERLLQGRGEEPRERAAGAEEELPALEVVEDHRLEVGPQQHVNRMRVGELPRGGDGEHLERQVSPAQVRAQLVVVEVRDLEECLCPEPGVRVVIPRVDRVLRARNPLELDRDRLELLRARIPPEQAERGGQVPRGLRLSRQVGRIGEDVDTFRRCEQIVVRQEDSPFVDLAGECTPLTSNALEEAVGDREVFRELVRPRQLPDDHRIWAVEPLVREVAVALPALDRARRGELGKELLVCAEPAIRIRSRAGEVRFQRRKDWRPPWVHILGLDGLSDRQIAQRADHILFEAGWPRVGDEQHRERAEVIAVVLVLLTRVVESLPAPLGVTVVALRQGRARCHDRRLLVATALVSRARVEAAQGSQVRR